MRKTRQQDKDEFEYVIKTLFEWNENQSIVIILRTLKYSKLSQLLMIDSDALQRLKCTKED